MKHFIALFFLTFFLLQARAQADKERSWSLNGYVKQLGTFSVLPDSVVYDNLIHNRLNFKWYAFDNLKFVAEMRNRLFTGASVENIPNYAELALGNADDYFDLSHTIEVDDKAVVHLMFDRLYLHYSINNLEIKGGRQRINWGINSVWNPNDIFNAFSYFDFDYEERPGSDALLIRYNTGIASSIEVAGKMADSIESFTGAALWKTNYKNYDYQILAGVSNMNAVMGGGWAGNIKKAGFKGEGSYFLPIEGATDTTEALVGTISLDYSFKSSLYLNGSVLYSSNGTIAPTLQEQLDYFVGNISAKFLSPYRWSVFAQSSYQFHPLVNGGLAIIGYPGSYDAFMSPYVTISLLQNLDLDLIAQLLFTESNNNYVAASQFYYYRFKFSF